MDERLGSKATHVGPPNLVEAPASNNEAFLEHRIVMTHLT
jgi:hypothetical protein